MKYEVETIAEIQGAPLFQPRHYVVCDLRRYRAANRADAEYLAAALNSMTDQQDLAALNAATANYLEAAE